MSLPKNFQFLGQNQNQKSPSNSQTFDSIVELGLFKSIRRPKVGKQSVQLKTVVYGLSPFQQKTMSGLWNDLQGEIHHKVSENWISTSLLLGHIVCVYTYQKIMTALFIFGIRRSCSGGACKLDFNKRRQFHIAPSYTL